MPVKTDHACLSAAKNSAKSWTYLTRPWLAALCLAGACADAGELTDLASNSAALRRVGDDVADPIEVTPPPRVVVDKPVIEPAEPVEVTPPSRVCPGCIEAFPVDAHPIVVKPPRDWGGWDSHLPVVGRAAVFSYGAGTGAVDYWQDTGTASDWNELTGTNDRQLVGDFMGLGHDQALFVNYYGGAQRVVIADFPAGANQPTTLFREDFGASTLFDGWDDDNDLMIVGDFMGLGHDQVMAINRGGSGGLVMIVDFNGGQPAVRYLENWDSGQGYVGWLDDGEIPIAGDFMQLGYDQVMFFNRDGQYGRIMVQDFKLGAPHRDMRYYENWGENVLLNGWNDAADRRYVGDFLGLGFDQVLFLNRFESGGRVMVADFRDGRAPVEPLYWENWSDSTLLNGWHDDNDWAHVGDFMGLGHDQIMFMNRSGEAGRVLVADFGAGSPAKVRYLEGWGANPLLNGWQDDDDVHLAGRFGAGTKDALLMFNNAYVSGRRDVVVVDNRDKLVQTLNSHFTGTISIPSYANIDLTGLSDLPVRSGVYLMGTRYGLDQGGLLFTDSLDSSHTLFAVRGNDVRISRLRFRGPKHPDTGRSPTLNKVNAIEILQDPVLETGKNILVSENEMWAWTDACVTVNGKIYANSVENLDPGLPRYTRDQAGLVRVTHNFLHHNAREGAGYGVNVSKGGMATIFANVFDYNRHAVASDGQPQTVYIAQYNYVLAGGYSVDLHDDIDLPFCASYWNQHFDVHGRADDGYGGVAGEYFDISYNTVRGEQSYCFGGATRPVLMLRGNPTIGAYLHDNVLVHDDAGAAVNQKKGPWSHMYTGPNQYNVDRSEEIAVGDFDGDKRSDVFLATGTSWFYSSGGLTEWRYLNASSHRVADLAFADIDNDGKTDVLSRQTDGVLYYSSAGTTMWQPLFASPENIQNLRFYDFNGDGFTDVFRTRNNSWYIWDGKTKVESSPGGSSYGLSELRFGEFDDVKGADVVAVANNQLSYSSGARLPWARLNSKIISSLSGTVVADMDGDGAPDIVAASGGTWSYSKSGRSDWITLRKVPATDAYASIDGVLFGDFDRDSRADALRFDRYYVTTPQAHYVTGANFLLAPGATGTFTRWSRNEMR